MLGASKESAYGERSRRSLPIAPLVLSAEERAYLERQVRRHRVARCSLNDAASFCDVRDGLASEDVAAELGHHEHTAGKWRRRFLKDLCDGFTLRRGAGTLHAV